MAPSNACSAVVGSRACCSGSRTEGKLGLGLARRAVHRLRDPLARSTSRAATPTFPATGSGLFVARDERCSSSVTMAGVVFFAEEEEGARRRGDRDARDGDRRGARTTTETAPAAAEGDAAAGEAVFASAGCGGCHTLEAAGSSGRSARTSTRRSPMRRSSSTASRTAPARCLRSRASSTSSRSRTSPRTSSRPRRARRRRIPCRSPGEVSERPKERDWKSRKRRKACRGFKSRPLRCCARSESAGADSDRAKTPEGGRISLSSSLYHPSLRARIGRHAQTSRPASRGSFQRGRHHRYGAT